MNSEWNICYFKIVKPVWVLFEENVFDETQDCASAAIATLTRLKIISRVRYVDGENIKMQLNPMSKDIKI